MFIEFWQKLFLLFKIYLFVRIANSYWICRFTSSKFFMVLKDTSRGLRQQIYLQYLFLNSFIETIFSSHHLFLWHTWNIAILRLFFVCFKQSETSYWKTSIRFFDANCWAKPRRFLEWKSLKKSHFYYTASEAM